MPEWLRSIQADFKMAKGQSGTANRLNIFCPLKEPTISLVDVNKFSLHPRPVELEHERKGRGPK